LIEIGDGVDWIAVDAYFVMEVGPGTVACGAYTADYLPLFDFFPCSDINVS
jgi:hypothetical protein